MSGSIQPMTWVT